MFARVSDVQGLFFLLFPPAQSQKRTNCSKSMAVFNDKSATHKLSTGFMQLDSQDFHFIHKLVASCFNKWLCSLRLADWNIR